MLAGLIYEAAFELSDLCERVPLRLAMTQAFRRNIVHLMGGARANWGRGPEMDMDLNPSKGLSRESPHSQFCPKDTALFSSAKSGYIFSKFHSLLFSDYSKYDSSQM